MSLSFSFKLLLSLIFACMSALSLADRITQPIPIDSVSDITDNTSINSAQISNKESSVSSNLIFARGVVLQVDQSNATIKINHDPITVLNWSRMTMSFRLKERSLVAKIKEGDVVEFLLEKESSDYIIVKLSKQNSTRSSQ
ncbi:MAG: copper-binding protein [Nitrosomonas sp.]|uniref:copper-binding protein n=1 Tax=Nitrosomonas sp. TaxID=42353 RepID=UPI002730A6D1|nr:copper-binding protein [Nitrosomonas sp.]MDP1550922.1 copper-binding protein [Nitrosomonas sp.]